MQGSHRSGGAHLLLPAPAPAPPIGPRHARRPGHPASSTASSTGSSTASSAQARRRAAARERMLARRRRSLGVLSLVVLAVTVVITITRPSPQPAAAASRDVPNVVPAGVYSANPASVPPGADADRVSAALLSVPSGGAAVLPSKAATPATWTQPAGARIHCPVTATACVDLAAKITWLQHGTQIFLGPVRMQPGEGSKKTPRGTFSITKKAAVYFSHTYGGAMPYSVFWGHDGIAYHEGTLTGFSHGCIHLSMANAKRFFAALRVGQRVYVA